MLRAVTGQSPPMELACTAADQQAAAEAIWLDMLRPTEVERALVERATALRLPTEAEISEVEASSRLVQEDEVLVLSTLLVSRGGMGGLTTTPLGFVLCPQRLITLRYADSQTFSNILSHWRPRPGTGGMSPFLTLIEALIDRMADQLEHEGAEVEALNARIFGADMQAGNPRARDAALRGALQSVGMIGERISRVRDGLLGALRIVRFVREAAADWLGEGDGRRLKTAERDIVSLNDYETQLMGKVQFLLDATLGFISIEQNNSVKILTVVSLVGILPTLLAGIWGMNFKTMPELGLEHGYFYALGVIFLSGVLPWLWFRRRGWA